MQGVAGRCATAATLLRTGTYLFGGPGEPAAIRHLPGCRMSCQKAAAQRAGGMGGGAALGRGAPPGSNGGSATSRSGTAGQTGSVATAATPPMPPSSHSECRIESRDDWRHLEAAARAEGRRITRTVDRFDASQTAAVLGPRKSVVSLG